MQPGIKIIRGLAGSVLLLLLASCNVDNSTVRLKLGHGLDTKHPVHQSMTHMADMLAEISGGTMRIDIYPNSQLGAERELIELLQIGSLDLTKASASPLESFSPQMEIFSIPYVFRDADHFWRVLQSDIGQGLLISLEKVRLRGLAFYDAGSRSFYMTHHEVRTPEDLTGLKIRVQKSKTSVEMVQALGAAATPIDWGELYTALQQGVVDGAENNLPSFYLSRHYEAAKILILDEHTFVPDVLMVSTKTWNALSPEQQGWLQQAAAASSDFQRKLWAVATEEALAAVREAGVNVIEPDKQTFRDAIVSMHQSYAGTPTAVLMERISALP